jgi:hypothetical protein
MLGRQCSVGRCSARSAEPRTGEVRANAARRHSALKDTLLFGKKLRPSVVAHTRCASVYPVAHVRRRIRSRLPRLASHPPCSKLGAIRPIHRSHFAATSRSGNLEREHRTRRTVLVWRQHGGCTSLTRRGTVRFGVGRPILKSARFLAGPGFSGMSIVRKMLGTLDLLTVVSECCPRAWSAPGGAAKGCVWGYPGLDRSRCRWGTAGRQEP